MNRIVTKLVGIMLLSLMTTSVFAQGGYQVKGVVTDAMGPVIGATVIEQGTNNGTVTGIDGDFTLNVASADAIVEVSCIGYTTLTFKASEVPATITLEEDSEFLDEVVVIGYGTVKKSDLTGSVTALKPDTKNKGVVVNAQDMLTGKIAGVSVTSGGGTPGGGSTIRIRGGSSLNASNDPLIVIDGLAMDNNGVKGLSNLLSMVNPADIESFNVLKDASATAIYGSRGSNGVIIITTKKGRANQAPQVSYNGTVSASMRKKSVDVMTGDEFRKFVTDLYTGVNDDPINALGSANTDWQSEIYRTAISHDHNVTVTGAAKNLPYRVSVGFTDEQGILKTSDFQRATASINLNPSFLDNHLNVNLNAKGMYATTQYADGNAIWAATKMDPSQSIYDKTSPDAANFANYFQWRADGASLNDDTWPYTWERNATPNPVSLLNLKEDIAHSRSIIGSAEVDYQVHGFEALRLHATFGADLSYGKQDTWTSPNSPYGIYYGSEGFDEITKRNLSFNTYAQYNQDFDGGHHFDIMGGYEWQHFWRSQYNDYVGYYPKTNNENPGAVRPHTPWEFKTENYLVSFFGRANYNYADKYLLTATVRYDGSSRFRQHWSLFPSFAFAWKIKEESFLKDVEALSDLKLRLGWGQTGQQELNVKNADYPYFAVYEKTSGTNGFYPVTGSGELFRPTAYDPNLHWETTTTTNVGLDFGFANDRLTGSLDWYNRVTTDLINTAYVAAGSNFRNQITTNIGSLRNTGVELALDYKIIQSRDWFWTVNYNVTYNQNEITELIGGDDGYFVPTGGISAGTGNNAQAHAVGHPASSFYLYEQVYDKDGLPIEGMVVDRNNDGVINENDKYFTHSPMAPVTMGLSSRLEYKNWDFGFSLRASIGNYVYNDMIAGSSNVGTSEIWALSTFLSNRPKSVLAKNWQSYDWVLSDYFLENASFLKCDNITLGYSFNELFKGDRYHGIGGRIYGTVNNAFCLTKYSGIDPEVFGGIDNNLYPRPITFLMGLSLNF
ncbi:MAG: TonB-dependent receptor [Bacteroidales bacterium]|nr:TonB-dependent receptor [Bacteroidales bacterium]